MTDPTINGVIETALYVSDLDRATQFCRSVLGLELMSRDERLSAFSVAIESKMMWARGGTSLYIRDPDGHLLELPTPGVWTIY